MSLGTAAPTRPPRGSRARASGCSGTGGTKASTVGSCRGHSSAGCGTCGTVRICRRRARPTCALACTSRSATGTTPTIRPSRMPIAPTASASRRATDAQWARDTAFLFAPIPRAPGALRSYRPPVVPRWLGAQCRRRARHHRRPAHVDAGAQVPSAGALHRHGRRPVPGRAPLGPRPPTPPLPRPRPGRAFGQPVLCIGYQRFLYYASHLPHVPLYASDDFLGRSTGGLYGDVVAELHASVGELLREIHDLGVDDETLVVFTSDNGPWLLWATDRPVSQGGRDGGSAGALRQGKSSTFEGGMRVPLIARWPRHTPAWRTIAEARDDGRLDADPRRTRRRDVSARRRDRRQGPLPLLSGSGSRYPASCATSTTVRTTAVSGPIARGLRRRAAIHRRRRFRPGRRGTGAAPTEPRLRRSARNTYVSVSGEARVRHDPSRATELWNGWADGFFPGGPDVPNVGVLEVTVRSAQYWDIPAACSARSRRT